ncbi:MAG: prolipoprotein diacylglyceryl transferase family protein [Acidobacteriota bacterium]
MHPILFEIGDFPVGSYALMVLIGLLLGVGLFAWLGTRLGKSGALFAELGLWAFVIAIASSKIFGAIVGLSQRGARVADQLAAVTVVLTVTLIGLVVLLSWLRQRGQLDGLAVGLTTPLVVIAAILAWKLGASVKVVETAALKQSIMALLRYSGHYYIGFISGAAFLGIALHRNGVSLGRGLDALAPSLALAHAFGRLGCFLAGCCWGKDCSLPWAVTFTSERARELTGVPLHRALHPTQLYESGGEIVIASLLLFLHLRWPSFAGRTFLLYVAGYGVLRFFLEFVRADPGRALSSSFSISQALAAVSVVAAIGFIVWRSRQAGSEPQAA